MRPGDPVRARVPGRHRLVRGVVRQMIYEGDTIRVLICIGLGSIEVPYEQASVIRRRGEREMTLARVESLRREVASLVAQRGNKILPGGERA